MQLLHFVSLWSKAASHTDICCLSVYLRSPVPPRLRGLPSLIMREQRRDPVSPTVLMFGCVALCAALVFSNVCASKAGKYQGWREVLRKITPHEKASLTLHEGET